ncbi:MAG: aspartyl/glutamyl-tRNA amidotransferase subunit A [Erysipelotrichaceae bacterium]|nr:aspartyl/glutamyl-tRNA amidotransferase subunit A [Erysipelotrichaceae bacterium]
MRITDYKKQKPAENAKDALAKAKALQPALNAVVTFYEDTKQQADAADAKAEGLLRGVPIALKDNVSTKDVRTTASSRILNNYVPVYNAAITEKLRDAGAIFIAKASMDELGMGGTNLNAYTGKVNNPWDVTRISGGSSGGSAALVASGVVPMAIGTDTGDSVRKPAAYCGVIGMKPTYGRISRYGIIPYASSLDHVGFFTRCVEDAAVTLQVLAGRDDRDLTSSFEPVLDYSNHLDDRIEGKRIAILDNVQNAVKDEESLKQFDTLMKSLSAKGAVVEHITLRNDLMQALLPTYSILANAEATANHSNLDGIRFGMREPGASVEEVMINSRTKGFSPAVRKRFVTGSYSLFVENQDRLFRKAQKVRRLIVQELEKALQNYDAVIACAAGSIAPHAEDTSEEKLSQTYLVAENHMLLGNFSGYPSITVPLGFVGGMPIGVSLTAKPFEEQQLLNIAAAIEKETGLADQTAEVKA